MAEYADREKRYNDNLGSVVGKYCTAIVEADSLAKDAHAKRVIALIDEPNAEFTASTSLVGLDESLETRVSVPLLAVTDLRPVIIDEATLELDMTVSATTESETRVDSKTSVAGSGKVGWGPFSIGVKMSADVSVGKTDKRKSDYRSHTNARVTMRQGEVPEGLSLILDSLNQSTSKSLEINQMLISRKAAEIAESAGSAELPPATDASGDDSGDDS